MYVCMQGLYSAVYEYICMCECIYYVSLCISENTVHFTGVNTERETEREREKEGEINKIISLYIVIYIDIYVHRHRDRDVVQSNVAR